MKRRSIKYAGLVLLCVAGCMFATACGQGKESPAAKEESVIRSEEASSVEEKSTEPTDYEIGTREHYIAAMAQEQEISYDAAENLERMETNEIALSDSEAIGYATVDKECGSVSNGDGCNEKTAFSADIRYIYQKSDGMITAIDKIADAKIYFPEVADYEANMSDLNINLERNGYRISATAVLKFILRDTEVTQGGEFATVETTGNKSIIITTAKTFAILFQQSDVKTQ